MAKLKSYEENQRIKAPAKLSPMSSGVACTEKKCKGEMMIVQPVINHPQLPLKRAICNKCKWRGWV